MKSHANGLLLTVCALVLVTGCMGRELHKSGEVTRPYGYGAGSLLPSVACADVGVSGGQGGCDAVEAVSAADGEFAGVDPLLAAQTSSESKSATRTLESIYFTFDSIQLSEEARSALIRNYEVLRGMSRMKVRIEGNCDERGSDEYNLALGDKRARIARDYLISLGLASERISTLSLGNEMASRGGHDEASWSQSRRDDFIVDFY